jgi:hypothetical protein
VKSKNEVNLASDGSPRNIVELLDNVFDSQLTSARAMLLTQAEMDELADGVAELYRSHAQSPPEDADTCFYSGGWVARNLGGPLSAYLLTSLLYSPRAVIHDPVAEFFNPRLADLKALPGIPSAQRRPGGNPAMVITGDEVTLLKSRGYYVSSDPLKDAREHLALAFPALSAIAPLIRSGIVVPIDEIALMSQMESELHAAVNRDVRDSDLSRLITQLTESGTPPARSNFIRGADVTPTGGVASGNEKRATVQNPAYYFEKTMAIAAATGSRYVAPSAGDAAMLEFRLKRLGERLSTKTKGNTEMRMLPALVTSELPFLDSPDPHLLMSIRDNESAFQDWRAELRDAVRLIDSLPSEGNTFAEEARAVLQDRLLPRANEVRRVVSTSRTMRAAAADNVADFGIAVAAIVGAGAILGPEGALAAGVTAGLTVPLKWAYQVLFRPSPSGASAVIAQLVKR